MQPIYLNTVADLIEHGERISATCMACGHRGWVDLSRLPPDLPARRAAILARIYCGECGLRDAHISIIPPGTD